MGGKDPHSYPTVLSNNMEQVSTYQQVSAYMGIL